MAKEPIWCDRSEVFAKAASVNRKIWSDDVRSEVYYKENPIDEVRYLKRLSIKFI